MGGPGRAPARERDRSLGRGQPARGALAPEHHHASGGGHPDFFPARPQTTAFAAPFEGHGVPDGNARDDDEDGRLPEPPHPASYLEASL